MTRVAWNEKNNDLNTIAFTLIGAGLGLLKLGGSDQAPELEMVRAFVTMKEAVADTITRT